MTTVQMFAIGALGAFCQEVLWWFNARHSLDQERYKKLIHSLGYWIVTALFILVTGGIIVIWFMDGQAPSPRTCLLTGAAAPLLIKQGLKALTPSQHLGSTRSFSFRDYLQ